MSLSLEQVLKARTVAQEQLDELESSVAESRTKLRLTLAKCDEWLWANTEHNADTVIAEFVELRDQRAELKKAYETDDEFLKQKMELRNVWLLDKITKDGLESIRTEHGTAYTQNKTRYNVSDWTNYWDWLAEHRRFDLLEKRPAQGPLAKMEENGEEMPPGLSRYVEKTVTVRRA